jgi:hypothetical protein
MTWTRLFVDIRPTQISVPSSTTQTGKGFVVAMSHCPTAKSTELRGST